MEVNVINIQGDTLATLELSAIPRVKDNLVIRHIIDISNIKQEYYKVTKAVFYSNNTVTLVVIPLNK